MEIRHQAAKQARRNEEKNMPDGYVGHGMGGGQSPGDGGYARHTWVAESGVVRSAAGWMMPAATSCSR